MTSEDNARPFFEKYVRNLKMNVDRLENGQYTDAGVENSWMDYLCGWVHSALFSAKEERAKLLKQLDEIRKAP